jgi:acyl carrier protein
MNNDVFDQIQRIAADVFQIPAAQLKADSSPAEIETWDSVQHLNLILAVEQEFDLQFEPEEIDEVKSIGALAELVARKRALA